MNSVAFDYGVLCLARVLIKKSVSDGHEGGVSTQEIEEAAAAFGIGVTFDELRKSGELRTD